MSNVFEGILLKSTNGSIKNAINPKNSRWVLCSFNSFMLIYSKFGSRDFFEDDLLKEAEDLSLDFGSALVIRLDTRESYRFSACYENGKIIKIFENKDEIWVLLDDFGKPILDGFRYTTFESDRMRSEEPELYEFETVLNAIEIGMDYFGLDSSDWKLIEHFIAKL